VVLEFEPYQSLLLKIDNDGKATFVDIGFTPKTPLYEARFKGGRNGRLSRPGNRPKISTGTSSRLAND
jgi:hypothetical protein